MEQCLCRSVCSVVQSLVGRGVVLQSLVIAVECRIEVTTLEVSVALTHKSSLTMILRRGRGMTRHDEA